MKEFIKNDIRYRINNDGTASVAEYIGSSSSVVIPEKAEEYTVTRISAEAFENCPKVRQIQIPASVICIEHDAFKNCGCKKTVDEDLSRAYTATCRRDLEYMFGYGYEGYESRMIGGEDPVKVSHDFTAVVVSGSYAESYCRKNKIRCSTK